MPLFSFVCPSLSLVVLSCPRLPLVAPILPFFFLVRPSLSLLVVVGVRSSYARCTFVLRRHRRAFIVRASYACRTFVALLSYAVVVARGYHTSSYVRRDVVSVVVGGGVVDGVGIVAVVG